MTARHYITIPHIVRCVAKHPAERLEWHFRNCGYYSVWRALKGAVALGFLRVDRGGGYHLDNLPATWKGWNSRDWDREIAARRKRAQRQRHYH